MQRNCAEVLVDDRVLGYIAALVRATRRWPTFSLGVSPRAGVAILRGARAVAALEGRDYTVPDDVQEVVLPALRHRVMLTPEAEIEGRSPDELLDRADPLGRGPPAMSVPRIWPGRALALRTLGAGTAFARGLRERGHQAGRAGPRPGGGAGGGCRPGEPARGRAVPRRPPVRDRPVRWASPSRSRSRSRT